VTRERLNPRSALLRVALAGLARVLELVGALEILAGLLRQHDHLARQKLAPTGSQRRLLGGESPFCIRPRFGMRVRVGFALEDPRSLSVPGDALVDDVGVVGDDGDEAVAVG
jgi:hypothetical protein